MNSRSFFPSESHVEKPQTSTSTRMILEKIVIFQNLSRHTWRSLTTHRLENIEVIYYRYILFKKLESEPKNNSL